MQLTSKNFYNIRAPGHHDCGYGGALDGSRDLHRKSSTVALAQNREETVMNGLIAAAISTQEIVQ